MATGVTASTNLTELVPEITLEADFIYQNMALGESLVRVVDISGMPGLTVEFPIFTEVDGSDAPGETGAPTSHQMDLTMPTFTVARRAVNVHLGDLARVGAQGDTVSQIGRAMGLAKAKQVDNRIFGILTGTTNWTTRAGATNAALTITHILDGLNLLELNEVDDQLFGVYHPFQYKTIRSALTPIANDDGIAVGIADEMSRNGTVSRAFGITHFVTNRVGSGTEDATANVYNGLLFSRDGIGYGKKSMGVNGIEFQREAEDALTKMIDNWADTADVVRVEAVCKLYSTSS